MSVALSPYNPTQVTDDSGLNFGPLTARPVRWLFFKERFAWPRSSGHDVHTFFMMQALAQSGHAVSIATVDTPSEAAMAGVPFVNRYVFNEQNPPVPPSGEFPLFYTKSQEKFRSYWGISEDRVRQFAAAAADCKADVVVVSGLNVLPYLGAIANRKRVWYAADEWVWHHLSMVKPLKPSTWGDVKLGITKGIYERAYRSMLDRVWVVSKTDAKAFRWFAGMKQTQIIPNGVDANHYSTETVEQLPNSCVFWGRLDFGPNIQAVEWFCKNVWPAIRAKVPTARFRIYGFQPTLPMLAFHGKDGIDVSPNLPDIRRAVRSCQAVVLPFVSGGGIKNKLLEAAAMGMPVVCTTRVTHGLKGEPPLAFADQPADWVRVLTDLWSNELTRKKMGADARAWVTEHHTWDAAARAAAAGMRDESKIPHEIRG